MGIETYKKPDFIFEVAWEVCNKVTGVHTVLATKAETMTNLFKDNYIVIGPDLRQSTWDTQEFIEHPSLFKSWQQQAQNDGLSFRIGRWNVPGSPITILVDFTTYFASRDQIFAHFWEKYKLDSLSGGWDYIEPVMFGYAAGRIIESFFQYNFYSRDNILAHFHHWMSASGILYLKEFLPEVSTMFTVHGTSLAEVYTNKGNSHLTTSSIIDPGALARELNVTSKHSLEYIAANQTDVLASISEATSMECELILHRKPDTLTLNGFEKNISKDLILIKKEQARNVLLQTASRFFGTHLDENTLIIGHSGRYQIKNKGIDLFIDILDKLNGMPTSFNNILAFIMVPFHNTGPRYEVTSRMQRNDFEHFIAGEYLTHGLNDEENDAILNLIKKSNLKNKFDNKVKIIYIPAYLNANDGILNKDYYEILPGFDMMVFPSYYEPWGYTAMESISHGVSAATTTFTGFGKWLKEHLSVPENTLLIADRDLSNEQNTIDVFSNFIVNAAKKTREELNQISVEALNLSTYWSWQNLIEDYFKAYMKALDITEERMPEILLRKPIIEPLSLSKIPERSTEWHKIFVKTYIPEKLLKLQDISKNLWWCWQSDARKLFESIDQLLWEKVEHNPIALLNSLSYEALLDLEKNEDFLNRLDKVAQKFDSYMSKVSDEKIKVAYFSMEFGIHDSLKIFSGGLGVLAGDYLKEASDTHKNITGIGLLYRYGYFHQKITSTGEQISERIPQKFSDMPVQPVRDKNGEWIKINISLPGRTLYAKVWQVEVGRIHLFLLDTDIEENNYNDRAITHQLYGGNNEHRLKQEILLGIGGIKAIDAIGIEPHIYHCNEGHAAFSSIERLRKYIQNEKFTFDEALEIVRATTLFTTHTPVPAGHDFFSEDLLRAYLPHYAERLNISWDNFVNLGKMKDNDLSEEYSMSVLAVKTSQEVNGVSRIHGKVSREMFNKMWKDYYPDELHIGYVTNGVHMPTWTADNWKNIYQNAMGQDYETQQANFDMWQNIHNISNEHIWNVRQHQRKILMDYVKIRMMQNMTSRQDNPKMIFEIIDNINDNALTIGFARRFATYKRAHLLFQDRDKLSKLVNNPERPLIFIFAGKAHPADGMGQDLIKRIVEYSKQKDFLGKIIFIENYDMNLASKLVQGVDIWLNTPTRPLEASGTSGEKAIMNGVVNLSVLDGWWAEGYKPNAGWALKEERTYQNQGIQDELDAETIYNMLSDEIIPTFYDRDDNDTPHKWISYVKNTISEVAPHFTMNRMINDYYRLFYSKLYERSHMLFANQFRKVKEIAMWKKKMIRAWSNIEVKGVNIPDASITPFRIGENFKAIVTLDLAELTADDIGIEIIFGQKEMDQVKEIIYKKELEFIAMDNNLAQFGCEIFITRSGVFDYAFRMYAKNPLLPHKQDFNLVRWF